MIQHLKSEVRGGYPPLALKKDGPAPRMLEREAGGGVSEEGTTRLSSTYSMQNAVHASLHLIHTDPEESIMLLPFCRCGD